MADPQVVVDTTRIRTLVERSDVDPNQRISADDLGSEDWGDGFRVEPEPVLVQRGADGAIVRVTPLSEVEEKMAEVRAQDPVVAQTRLNPTPLGPADREKMVRILAVRLFKWYASQPPSPTLYNPVYDGIPHLSPGSPENLQPIPGTSLYPASPGDVLEWIKTTVIGPRAEVINRQTGQGGYISELRFSRNPDRLS